MNEWMMKLSIYKNLCENTNRHNSAAIWDIFTKFGTEIDTGHMFKNNKK